MTIDSLTLDQNHGPAGSDGTPNNADCNDFVLGGEEPINWAYITRSGQSQAPANPLFTGRLEAPNFSRGRPGPAEGPADESRATGSGSTCTTRRPVSRSTWST